jgi:myosin heavy subunit
MGGIGIGESEAGCEIGGGLEGVCRRLGVDAGRVRRVLLWKVRVIGKEEIMSPLPKEACQANLDSLLRLLYSRLFDQLI